LFHGALIFSNRKLLAIVVLSNCLIIGVSFAALGWNVQGAGSAARNTARFAIVFFLLGFAAPGLRRWLHSYPEPSVLIQAFVAALMVHFASVILLHGFFLSQSLHISVSEVAVVGIGFFIVASAGMTANPHPQRRFYNAVHRFALYAIFLILAADYLQHPVKPLRLIAIPVLLSLLLRHLLRRRVVARLEPA
jgi:hypothetical protein